jgi:hypothetical protein
VDWPPAIPAARSAFAFFGVNLALENKKNWDLYRSKYKELIVKEGWDVKFEEAYRKRQAHEWSHGLKTEKLCEDAVMALLTKFNEEITPQERTRRWNSLPSVARKRANDAAGANRRRAVNWNQHSILR